MRAGLLALSKGEGTTDPLLSRYLLARQINLAAGGAVIAPWEVDQLPDCWIDAATALAVDLPEMTKGQQEVQKHLDELKRRHQKQNGR